MSSPFKRICAECGESFETKTKDRLFCTDAHKANFHNRSSKIGRVVVPLAMAWRAGRNVKGSTPEAKAMRASAARAFADLCRALDEANRDDTENRRLPKVKYLRRRWADMGTLTPEEIIPHKAKA